MIKPILLGFLSFLVFLSAHAIIFRFAGLNERFRAIKWIFYSIIPFYAALYFAIPSKFIVIDTAGTGILGWSASLGTVIKVNSALYFLSGLMLYVFLFLGYCQFYFIVDRSISVRIMIEIENSRGKRLSEGEIFDVYPFDGILRRRLEHMLYGGYLREESGYYVNTRKGRAQALVFRFLKDFLRLGKGG